MKQSMVKSQRLGHLRVFGCTAYSHIDKDERQKLDAKARKCILLGYPSNRKGYQLYDLSIRRVIHSQDVKFNESVCGFEKDFTTDAADKDPQVVIDTTRDDSKPLTDDPSEETEGANIEERTEESSAEPEGGNTEPTVKEKLESLILR